MDVNKPQPAFNGASAMGIVIAIVTVLNLSIGAEQVTAWAYIVAVLVPVIGGLGIGKWIKSRVSPVDGDGHVIRGRPDPYGPNGNLR